MRLPTEILNELMFLFLGLTVVTLLQYVGVGLVILMILTPASVAYILTHRFASMIWVSVLVGVFSSIMGLYLSYYLSIASGSASVLTASAIFCVVIVLKGGKIVLSDWIKEFKMKK
jgi:ABC-type Mn2+/Zn2+ transport system permease subunit